jgi:hypothetical protein
MHQRPIVYIIQKIQLSTLGSKMARNELRLKYHYHTCLIPLQPDLFLKLYDILYSRILGFNRYTIILGKKNEYFFNKLNSKIFICSCWKYYSINNNNIW